MYKTLAIGSSIVLILFVSHVGFLAYLDQLRLEAESVRNDWHRTDEAIEQKTKCLRRGVTAIGITECIERVLPVDIRKETRILDDPDRFKLPQKVAVAFGLMVYLSALILVALLVVAIVRRVKARE